MADAARLMAREIEPDVHLPYVRHVTETVISLSTRALMTTIRLDGIAFETADVGDLNDLHAKLNLTLRNLADDRLAIWTHLIRRRDTGRRPPPASSPVSARHVAGEGRSMLLR